MNKKKIQRAVYVEDEMWSGLLKLARKIDVSANSLVRRGIKLILKQQPKF
jgi:hypothetical protein